MRKIPDECWDIYFEEFIVPYIRKHRERIFPEINKNLCLEHYNELNKTNYTEKDIELNQTECWLCKAIKDRP